MPLIPASLSSLNQKVESARKNFNSNLDRAGEKTGVFKPTNPPTSQPPPSRTYPQHQPPPPPRQHQHQPPPPTRHPKLNPPPPPPRKLTPQPDYNLPPPAPSRPTQPPPTPYRPPPETINGYGPPSFPPVQPSSRYGPPSPPRSPSHYHPPPPVVSSNKPIHSNPPPAIVSQPKTPARSITHKHGQIPFPPFSQFTETDKQAFFEMLDEFFALKFPDRKPPTNNNNNKYKNQKISGRDNLQEAPLVALHTRPTTQEVVESSHVSRAETLARYMSNHRHCTAQSDQWYNAEDPVPPTEQGSQDVKRMSCWSQTGRKRTQINYILFPDLSQIWTQVIYDVDRPFPPGSVSARYRPPPGQIDEQTMVEASEIYGNHVVLFAENAERSGRHVARGECWDLANEALKAFPGTPPPLTSISRTHGILLYYGHSSGHGIGVGTWKQSNDFGIIRPGDIIEWRLVACDTVNPTLSCTLGDPDHTAIILESTGSTMVQGNQDDNGPYRLGYITVVEQSLKQIPVRRTYNLSTMSRGQVWIYRPMGEYTLLGSGANQAAFPPPHPSFQA